MRSYIFHLLLLIKVAILAHFIDKKTEARGNEVTLACTLGLGVAGGAVCGPAGIQTRPGSFSMHNPSCPATQSISQI